ncbi:MAG: pyridoxamine 5'-phosphate oxidase family protein [Kordiimonadaceae bacterium]|nr:pyridoxamine 5'-phosphate oxidase family protein [Kordiimonadaceae bacterium]
MNQATANDIASPFHEGELAIQERYGVREKMHQFSAKIIRDHMPDQHRAFYGALPYLIVGSLDASGQPWASMLVGAPGFLSSPDNKTLRASTKPLFGDPLNANLEDGAAIGLLGIELHTRRRNRMNGTVSGYNGEGFDINVGQSFGNCPKYIQARDFELLDTISTPEIKRPVHRSKALGPAEQSIIRKADAFFIASAFPGSKEEPRHGVDASHRGGKPGFIHLEDDTTFLFPDFTGNNAFNTLGNVTLNPKVGFLFPDFETGDMLYIAADAEIIWEGEQLKAFRGAERLIRVRIRDVIRVENSLPIRWTFNSYAPNLVKLGSWDDTFAALGAEKSRNTWRTFSVTHKRKESDTITSFYLAPKDGRPVCVQKAGQYLPIKLNIPGEDGQVTRTYTISDVSDGKGYRLSVKREENGTASKYLHDHIEVGSVIEAMAPRGKFYLDEESTRSVVLLSGGVGITPMIAMANKLIRDAIPGKASRAVHFFHGARNGSDHAFGDTVRQLEKDSTFFSAHIRYSQPKTSDVEGVHFGSEGRLDVALLKAVLGFDDYDFYLCGPAPFMKSLYEGLTEIGINDDRIHYESFGPATVFGSAKTEALTKAKSGVAVESVKVSFAKSGKVAVWKPEDGSLLELAEAQGLSPAFSCRDGVCGSCITKVVSGSVEYAEEPIAEQTESDVLICCSTPRQSEKGLVLDL